MSDSKKNGMFVYGLRLDISTVVCQSRLLTSSMWDLLTNHISAENVVERRGDRLALAELAVESLHLLH
jgi:hypothetical protein